MTCSVSDPVTGQIKTEQVRGGEQVTCVVYPQAQAGDKCDILRNRVTTNQIPGYVLRELVQDVALPGPAPSGGGAAAPTTATESMPLTAAQLQALLNAYSGVTVTSSNTLRVGGDFTNRGTLIVTATGRVVAENRFDSTGSLTLTDGARVQARQFGTFPLPAHRRVSGERDGEGYYFLAFDLSWAVTFDANGGALPGAASAVTDTDGRLAALPTPTRAAAGTAYTFAGWFTAEDGGTEVTSETVFAADATVYALWDAACSGWTYDARSGALAVTGDAAMGYTYPLDPDNDDRPWAEFQDAIQTVTIGSGVTKIASHAFYTCSKLQTVTFADGVTLKSMGTRAFDHCAQLKRISIPGDIASIPSNAFFGCTALTEVSIPATVTVLETNAFNGCAALGDIYFGGTSAQWSSVVQRTALPGSVTIHCTDDTYTVTFDANGGEFSSGGGDEGAGLTVARKSVVTGTDGRLAEVPTPTRPTKTEGDPFYVFAGWFTAQDGGDSVTIDTTTVFTRNTTVYAHWNPTP